MKQVGFDIYWEDSPAVRVRFDTAGEPCFQVLDAAQLPVLLYGMDGKA